MLKISWVENVSKFCEESIRDYRYGYNTAKGKKKWIRNLIRHEGLLKTVMEEAIEGKNCKVDLG